MEIRTAKRTRAQLRIGLQGPSGSGKTYSSLLLAFGITGDWSRVTIIDTENNSADLYAHLGSYNVLPLAPPFTPERYIEAIEKVEKSIDVASVAPTGMQHATNVGSSAIIIDSLSHEWEGTGGILDIHNNMVGNSFTNWGKLTPRHNAFINKILQSQSHVICNIRAKQDYVLSEKNGKMVPEKVGMKGITREGTDYEMTLVLELDMKNNAVSTKDRTGLFTGKPEFRINTLIGKKLLEWANKDVDPAEVKAKITKSTSLEELVGIYNEYPSMHEQLRTDFLEKKKLFTPKPTQS
jgi:hypothetical protein